LLIGYYSSGVLFEHGSRLPFYFSAGSISVIVVLLLLPTRTPDPAAANPPIKEDVVIPRGRGFRKTAWLANFATNFSLGGTAALFPQLATHLGIGANIHGGLLSAGRAAALATFAAMQFLMFWRTRLWPLWVAQLCCAASIVWIGLAHATWMFAVAWIIGGAVSGYAYQASIYFTLEEMIEKGKGSGFHEAILGGGMCFGPLLAGWVGNTHGLRFPYFFCAVVQIAIVALQMMVAWTQRRLSAIA
jgi:MFS family permease